MDIAVGYPLPLTPAKLVGTRTAVLGESGMGKSNTVAVLIEELAPHMPVGIIDPEGEMYTLRDRLNVLVVGRSENVDIDIQPHQAATIARWSVESGHHVILDLFDYDDDEIGECATGFAEALFDACKRHKRPYMLFVEEADIFFPQPLPQKSVWKHIAKRGRKTGLGMVLATQRSQNVDKNVLTQCQTRILHGVTHPRDVSVYKDLTPLPPREVEQAVRDLNAGQAIVVYKGNGTQVERGVQIRLRHTHHAGATPTLGGDAGQPPVAATSIDAETVGTLKKLLTQTAKPQVDPAIVERDKRIAELESQVAMNDRVVSDYQQQIAAATIQIERLQERIETLRLIQIAPIQVEVRMVDGEAKAAVVGAAAPPPPAKSPPAVYKRTLPFAFDDDDTLRQRQRQAFSTWKKSLLMARASDRAILWYLSAYPTTELTLNELATRLAYNPATLVNNPPAALCNNGPLQRRKENGVFHYQSRLRAYLQDAYPNLDVEQIASDLLRAIKP